MDRFALAHVFSVAAATALLAGALAVQFCAHLPPTWVSFSAATVALPILLLKSHWRWVGFALLGAAWTCWRADAALAQRLPHNLEGADIVVVGTVRGLPRVAEDATRFDVVLQSARQGNMPLGLRGTIRLSWYDNVPSIVPCARWQLRVRLRRPRGLVDPGAFDFERYALSDGISATGSVRESIENLKVGDAAICVDGLRQRISQGIADTLGDSPESDLMRAMAFGDQHAMDEHEWNVARATGIPHLIAISGLHIALFAGFGVLLMRLLWKLCPRLTLRWPAPLLEAFASISFAVAYATIAGLGLPTRRALVMIGVLLAANFARRARAPQQGLAFAVIVLLAIDPLCILSAGFWLSFVGVGWLMFCLGGRGARAPWWREMVNAQAVASVGLLPLGIWFFGQSSLIGPVANILAVPLVCFVILPLTVLGALLQLTTSVPAIAWCGASLLHISGFATHGLWQVLASVATWPGALWYFAEPSISALALAMLGALWLLLPRGMPARALGLFLFLPLLLPVRPVLRDGEFDALMLDVGQGLSMVVRTREHVLLYDAGAKFPSGFDLGDAAVVPALRAIGVRSLDRIVISHGDNDHAGGVAAVRAAYPAVPISSGEPERLGVDATQCMAGETWIWNGVTFRVVHPHLPLAARDNDRCCVIEVRSGDSALLLSGDISAAVEGEVAAAVSPPATHIVLQVPHHGSKTSSSEDFIALLEPEIGLVSAGYRNHFNHPNPLIVARYAQHEVQLLNTASSGFVRLHFRSEGPAEIIERGRIDRHPYWRE